MSFICQDATNAEEALSTASKWTPKQWWVDRIMAVDALYGPWIEAYRGSISRLSVAQGIAHESKGDPFETGDPSLGEAGLWSITTGVAEKFDIDPWDPEAAIWAGAYLRNDRKKRIMQKPFYNWLADADPHDWTAIVGKLTGSLGWGGWKTFMAIVFPGVPSPESARRYQPYDYMRKWLEGHADEIPPIGNMSGATVACRAYRSVGVDWLETQGALDTPGEWILIPRPAHLPSWNPKKYKRVLSTPPQLLEQKFPEYFHLPVGRMAVEVPRVRPATRPVDEPVEDPEVIDQDDLDELTPAVPPSSTRGRNRWLGIALGAAGLTASAVGLAVAATRRKP